MFDFAWSEIALIAVVALIAIGPKDMPAAIRAVTDWIKKARRMAAEFQTHVDEMVREADLSEVRSLDQRNPQLRHQGRDRARRSTRTARSARTFASNPLEPTTPAVDVGRGDRRQRAGDREPTSSSAPAPDEPVVAAGSRACRRAPAFVPPNLVHPAPAMRDSRRTGAAGFHSAGCRAATPTRVRCQPDPATMADIEEDDPIDDKPMPLLEHLIELRRRLMWSIGAFIICFIGVVPLLRAASTSSWPSRWRTCCAQQGNPDPHLIYTQLYEAFFTRIKVAFFGGAFIAFPIIANQIWLFVAPGLYRSEKRAMLPFLAATPVLFLLGAALAYYFVFPFAWRFFASFQIPTGGGGVPIELLPRVSEYLDLVMKLIFAFGLTFELPVLLTLLAKVGIISSKGLKKFRRYAYVGMFVIAAILAPPDVITQTGLAVPLIALYEISILAAKMVEPKPVEV